MKPQWKSLCVLAFRSYIISCSMCRIPNIPHPCPHSFGAQDAKITALAARFNLVTKCKSHKFFHWTPFFCRPVSSLHLLTQTSHPWKSKLFDQICEIKKKYRPNVWYNVIATKHQTHTRGLHYEQYSIWCWKWKAFFFQNSKIFQAVSDQQHFEEVQCLQRAGLFCGCTGELPVLPGLPEPQYVFGYAIGKSTGVPERYGLSPEKLRPY